MADSGVVAPSRVEESEKSVFFLFKPEEIAKQVRDRVRVENFDDIYYYYFFFSIDSYLFFFCS